MKVLAFLSAGALVGAGLFLLWQSKRAPSERPEARVRPPAAAPRANVDREVLAPPRRVAEVARESAPAASGKPPVAARPTAGARKILGAVLGEDGPLPGAQVLILADGVALAEADTDPRGRFEISFPVPAQRAALRVVARGYATLERSLGNPLQPGQQYLGNLRVQRGTVLSGVVVDDRGLPLAGAEVDLSLWGTEASGNHVVETTRSGADGTFRFTNAPNGRLLITARAEGWGERTIEHQHLGARPDVEARIELVPASKLSLFLHEPDGSPVPEALVRIQSSEQGTAPIEATSGPDGRVVFDGLGGLTWTVRVTRPGYRPAGVAAVRADGIQQSIEVVPWPCIEGIVLTPERKPPPPGTKVVAIPGGARGDLVSANLAGDPVGADGRFRLCDLRPGRYVVRAMSPGFAPTVSDDVQVSDRGKVDIGPVLLREGGTLHLRLRSGGEPAKDVQVQLLRTPPADTQVWSGQTGALTDSPLTSDARGELVIEDQPAGDVWVVLRGEGTVPARAGPFALTDGRVNEPAPLELERGTPIHGRIVDANGAPVSLARVVLEGPPSPPPVFSDDAGRYELPPLPPGRYQVRALLPGRGPARETKRVQVELTADAESGRVDLVFE